MRWAAYRSGATTGADERAGLVTGDEVRGVRHTVLELLRGGDEAMTQAAREAHERPTEVLSVAELSAAGRLLAPVPQPPSVRDFMSFESHVVTALAAIGQTVDPVWYAQPVFYFTNPAAIYGPVAQVPMAPGTAMLQRSALYWASTLASKRTAPSPLTASMSFISCNVSCLASKSAIESITASLMAARVRPRRCGMAV